MISNLLQPRADVLGGRLQGVIDIERVSDPKKRALEARVKDFLASTYVSGEIRQLISRMDRRLNSADAETGLFLAEGHKGEGKSHALLIALHLIRHSSEFREWLENHGIKFSLPPDTRVIWRKFTDFPLESLWGIIADELALDFTSERPPSIAEFRKAIGDQKLVLIFDELESGIRAIPNPALQQQNLNFLQMLSEEANRAGSNLLVIASIYDGGVEPGLTLKRVARVELRFQDTGDRRRILFHRLFARSPLEASPEIDAVIQSYVNTWRRFGITLPTDYAEDFRQSYPFLPEVLEVVLERIRTLRGGFQGTRGSLGFLAALVRARCESAHVITMADASILDTEMRSWLADLDPAQNLLACAEANLRELRKQPFADQIASAVTLASLAPSPKEPGITEDELARQAIGPESDYNVMRMTLTNFKKFGSFFHEKAGSLFFDRRENAHAKINLRSLSVSDDEAWDKLSFWWANDILRDSDLVVFSDIASAQLSIEGKANGDLRVLASPRRLSDNDVHQLYFGLRNRNALLLLEPRDEKANLRTNESLLAYAKRWIAADYLARNADDASRSGEFSRIGGEDKRNALDYLKKTNFVYVQIMKYGATAEELDVQRETLPPAATREQLVQHLGRRLYPPALVQEHMAERLDQFMGRKVSQVEADYRNTPGFPVLTSHSVFLEAIYSLVEQGNVLALKHSAGDFCGTRPTLRSDQLGEAIFAPPFERIVRQPIPAAYPSQPLKPGQPEPARPAEGSATPIVSVPVVSTGETFSTGFLRTRQLIRQEVARLLEANGAMTARSLRFAITYDERHLDMASIPSFLRGNLTGSGSFAGEATLVFSGDFSKAQIEEMVERLPDFSPGACRLTLVLVPQTNTPKAHHG